MRSNRHQTGRARRDRLARPRTPGPGSRTPAQDPAGGTRQTSQDFAAWLAAAPASETAASATVPSATSSRLHPSRDQPGADGSASQRHDEGGHQWPSPAPGPRESGSPTP